MNHRHSAGRFFNFTGNGSLSGSDQIDLRDIHYGAIQDSYANGDLTGLMERTLQIWTSMDLTLWRILNSQATAWAALLSTIHRCLYRRRWCRRPLTQPTTIVAPGPNATLSDHGGNDTFVFAQNFGQATITNFAPGTDAIQLSQADFATASAVLAAAHNDGHGNVVIADANHDTITLQNLAVAQIHSSDFQIV